MREKLSAKPNIIKRIANTFIDVLRHNPKFKNVKVKQHGTDIDLIQWVQKAARMSEEDSSSA